jgi:prepilin-type N-terminal cleavage/methylation domain-containing protein
MTAPKNAGFSLVELMVGLTIGLIILVGVAHLFSSGLQSNLTGAREQQFEHGLRVLAYDLTTTIRRAGMAKPGVTLTPVTGSKYYDIPSTNTQCILFSHSTASSNEQFSGYRRNGNVIELYISTIKHGSCDTTDANGWTTVTDSSTTKITNFTFSGGPLIKITIEAESATLKLQDGTTPIKRTMTLSTLIRNA